ncbi:DUF1444 family protein [Ferribacterium limneticum]|uniref:DUF1444 family protein n=1 Tax=Ferribacterium limneticum TaxID=76259 RepID=UPI001CF98E36|nr:DUF1444 family protein [Ferribacterium limneticum]UCV19946.1 DUF1444 family protein [Ferribacterium limneticum]
MDREQLDQGRKLLIAGLIAALLSIPLLASSKANAFGMMCLIVAVLGGSVGIIKVADEIQTNGLAKWLSICLTLMPTFNLIPIAWFLLKAKQAIRTVDEAVPESLPPPLPKRSAPPPAAPAAKADNAITKALPAIKMAGLTGVSEGQLLETKISAPGIDIPEANQPVCQVLKGAFGAMYLVDQGNSYGFATMGEMKAAGLSPEELRQIGLKNLAAHLHEHKQSFKLIPLQNKAYGLRLDGHFEASLVLLDSLWEGALKKYLPNAPVVALPSRDVCAFCDVSSSEGIAELRAVSAKVSQGGDHLISPDLFIRQAGKWLPFEAGVTA